MGNPPIMKPGDTLVLIVKDQGFLDTDDEGEGSPQQIIDSIKAQLPGLDVHIIAGVEQMMAFRPEEKE